MNDIVVSFCIATFQRYEILKELLTEILSVESDKFEVVVCDDGSEDGSIEKIRQIQDKRLKVYVNERNVGSLQNIYESLEHGQGRFLFYVNDRDNVDFLKIKKLIMILEELEIQNVAFLRCVNRIRLDMDYYIFSPGEDSFLEFANRIVHPTGYIFRREVWEKIRNRKDFFSRQSYGDFSITLICAIMSQRYSGAIIYGDICELARERIDFKKEKSGYYRNRKDKRVWYSWEVQLRELKIAYRFLHRLPIEEELVDRLIGKRYREYLKRVTIGYEEIISRPSNTLHYDIDVSTNKANIYRTAIRNGLCLWREMNRFYKKEGKTELVELINYDTKTNFILFLKIIYRDVLKIL